MTPNEYCANANLIDLAIHAQGWTDDVFRRKEPAGAIEVIDGNSRKQARGRVVCTRRVNVKGSVLIQNGVPTWDITWGLLTRLRGKEPVHEARTVVPCQRNQVLP